MDLGYTFLLFLFAAFVVNGDTTVSCGSLLGSNCPVNGFITAQISLNLIGPPAPEVRTRIVLQSGSGLNYDILVQQGGVANCDKRCYPSNNATADDVVATLSGEKELWLYQSASAYTTFMEYWVTFKLRDDHVNCNLDAFAVLDNIQGGVPQCVSPLAGNCSTCFCTQCPVNQCCPTSCSNPCWIPNGVLLTVSQTSNSQAQGGTTQNQVTQTQQGGTTQNQVTQTQQGGTTQQGVGTTQQGVGTTQNQITSQGQIGTTVNQASSTSQIRISETSNLSSSILLITVFTFLAIKM